MNLKRHNEGFTLIEVMIALSILAIGLFSVLLTIQKSIRDTHHLRDKLASHVTAMNVLSGMQSGLLPIGAQTGDITLLGKKYIYQVNNDSESGAIGNGYYERFYVVVHPEGSDHVTARVVGFVKTDKSDEENNNDKQNV